MSNERNEDELVAPEWLNADYLTHILRESEHDTELEVKSFAISPATFKGDHFASIMFRAKIEYKQRDELNTKPIIIKMMPIVESEKKDMLKETKLFETEINIYKEVLPKFQAILKSYGDDCQIAPRCLYTSLEPQKILVFEDIVPAGYNVIRDRMIELDEIKIAVRKLAKWHAISYKLVQETPTLFDKYRYGLLSDANNTMGEFMYFSIDVFISMLEETPDLQQFAPLLSKIKSKVNGDSKSYFNEYFSDRQEHKFYALAHGDLHLRNLMFRSEPLDVKLLDFQICYMGPLVMDVIYLMVTLLPPINLLEHRNEVIFSYFKDFEETLKKIKFEGRFPKYSEFREQLMEHRYFEIFLVVTFLPMIYAVITGMDVTNIFTNIEARKALYRTDAFRKEMKSLLTHYLHMGYFEE